MGSWQTHVKVQLVSQIFSQQNCDLKKLPNSKLVHTLPLSWNVFLKDNLGVGNKGIQDRQSLTYIMCVVNMSSNEMNLP